MNETQEESRFKQRFSICQICPRFFKPTGQCKECGCFMRIKARIPSQKCPIGKW